MAKLRSNYVVESAERVPGGILRQMFRGSGAIEQVRSAFAWFGVPPLGCFPTEDRLNMELQAPRNPIELNHTFFAHDRVNAELQTSRIPVERNRNLYTL